MKPTYLELIEALRLAVQHLDYTGWGDSWERGAVEETGERDKIESTLKAAQRMQQVARG